MVHATREGMRNALMTAALALAAGLGTAGAQGSARLDYPNVNERVQLAPGETVLLLNRIMIDRAPGMRPVRRLEFHYRTSIPAADQPARAAQADRAAQVFGASAVDAGVRTIALAICDTDACARRAAPPRTWYLFELRAGNVWKLREQ